MECIQGPFLRRNKTENLKFSVTKLRENCAKGQVVSNLMGIYVVLLHQQRPGVRTGNISFIQTALLVYRQKL